MSGAGISQSSRPVSVTFRALRVPARKPLPRAAGRPTSGPQGSVLAKGSRSAGSAVPGATVAEKVRTRLVSALCICLQIGLSAWLTGAVTAAPTEPEGCRYALRIAAPLYQKAILGSGFYYRNETAVYLVTARHVLFAPTQIELKEAALPPVPRRLAHRVRYDKKNGTLSFDGVLSAQDRDAWLSGTPAGSEGRQAIERLYDRSRTLKLRSHTATVFGCSQGTGEYELRLTAMLNKGLVKYHPVQDVAVVRIGSAARCGDTDCIAFVQEVGVKKPDRTTALTLSNVKSIDDVALGTEVYVVGYPSAPSGRPTTGSSEPVARKMAVAGKSRGLGILLLDGRSHPGESGGPVLEARTEGTPDHVRVVGVISGVTHQAGNQQAAKDLSIAVALDAVMELVRE